MANKKQRTKKNKKEEEGFETFLSLIPDETMRVKHYVWRPYAFFTTIGICNLIYCWNAMWSVDYFIDSLGEHQYVGIMVCLVLGLAFSYIGFKGKIVEVKTNE